MLLFIFFFFYKIEDVPSSRKNGLRRCPSKTVIGVPGKVVYFHYTTALCCARWLSFRLKLNRIMPMATLLGSASHSAFRVFCRKKKFCYVSCHDFLSNLVSMLGP